MVDLSALFFLVAVVHGDAFSITELATFPTETACQAAADAVNAGLRDGTKVADIGCIPGKAIEGLQGKR
jgi:hypothetical protein